MIIIVNGVILSIVIMYRVVVFEISKYSKFWWTPLLKKLHCKILYYF